MPSFKRTARRLLAVAPGLVGLCSAQGTGAKATPGEAAVQAGGRTSVPLLQADPQLLKRLVAPTLTIRGEYRFGSKKAYNPNFSKSGSVVFRGDDAVEDKGFGTLSRVGDPRPRRNSAAGLAKDNTVRGVSFVPDPALARVAEPATVAGVAGVVAQSVDPATASAGRPTVPRSLTAPKPEDDFVTLGLASGPLPSGQADTGSLLQLTYGSRGTQGDFHQASHVHVVEDGVVLKEPVGTYTPGASLIEIVLNSQNQREYYIDGGYFYTSTKPVSSPLKFSVVNLRNIHDRIKDAHWLVDRRQMLHIRPSSSRYIRGAFIAFKGDPDVQDLGSGALARISVGDLDGDGNAISDQAIGQGTVQVAQGVAYRGARFVASPIISNPLYEQSSITSNPLHGQASPRRSLQAAQPVWTQPNPADVFAKVGLICGKSYFTMQLTYGDPAHEGFVTIVEDGEVPVDSLAATYVQGVSELEISLNSQDKVEYYVDDKLLYTSKRSVPFPCRFGVHNLRNLYDSIGGAQWLAVNVSTNCDETEDEPSGETTTPCDDGGPSRFFEERAAWKLDGGRVAAAGSSALLVMIAGLAAIVYRRMWISIQVEDGGRDCRYTAPIEET